MASGGLSTPKYGPMFIKQELPSSDNEEESSEKKIVYRCPHKRDEGGRCNARATDLNLLLNHFYKHHGRERLLAKTPSKFPMCCFREGCSFYFQEHSELVEHMYEHDKIPGENIYFTEYIKQIYQKEVIQARLDRPTKIVKIQKETDKQLELQFSKLRLESKNLKSDYENLRSETEAMKISSNFMNGQIVNLKNEKNVLKEKYDNLKTENKDLKTEGYYMKAKTINLGKDIQDLEQKYKNEVQELKEDKQYYKDKYAQEKRKVAIAKEYYDTNMEYEHKARYTNNNISDKKDIEIESLKRQLDKLKSNVTNDVRYEMQRYKKAKFY